MCSHITETHKWKYQCLFLKAGGGGGGGGGAFVYVSAKL